MFIKVIEYLENRKFNIQITIHQTQTISVFAQFPFINF